MNRASNALRRSSVRLMSLTSGHSELNLIISDMNELRSAAKHFSDAQENVWKDILKWASRERNEAIRESFSYFVELNRIWTDAQCDFVEQMSKFKYSFEMILEGEIGVDKLKEHLGASEARENKLNKDLIKAEKKNNPNEVKQIGQKIAVTKSSVKATQLEISERTQENEAVKLIRLKESMLKLSTAYMELAQKSLVIFDGQKTIASDIPEMDTSEGMHRIRYRGSEGAKVTVAHVKERVNMNNQSSPSHLQLSPTCPPPYTSPPPMSPPDPFSNPPSYENAIGFEHYRNGVTSRRTSMGTSRGTSMGTSMGTSRQVLP